MSDAAIEVSKILRIELEQEEPVIELADCE